MNTNRQLTTNVLIGGKSIPVISWQCHLNSYGNLCTFEVTTSIQQVKMISPDLFQVQQDNFKLECQIILVDNTGANSQVVFDGIVDTITAEWEHDTLEITGRDFSAVLRDKEETLDTYVNQTVSDIVTGIAKDNDLLAVITDTNQIAGIKASTFQGEDWALSISQRPTWNIIQQLADEVGYVAYVDQHKALHFEPPGNGKAHTYNWRPAGPQADNPILSLEIMQQSRRCSNFTLRVHGYDTNGKETIWKDVIRPKGGSGSGHFYNKARQDLNSQNCKEIANNLADEIERKNLVVKMVVEGDTSLHVNDTMRIIESDKDDLLGLSNRPLFITGVLHSFQMPDFGSSEGDGFLTHITCNQTNGDSSG